MLRPRRIIAVLIFVHAVLLNRKVLTVYGGSPDSRGFLARYTKLFLVVACLASIAGEACASTPGDPWERFNRRAFAVNHVLDRFLIRPLALFIRALTPGPLGRGVHHALVNVSEPVVVINDVLQGRFKRAGQSSARLAVNTTVGLGGVIDVATKWKLPHHDNSFGVTMGRAGVKSGPYLFLPLFGPTTVRDLGGAIIDSVSNPIFFIQYPHSNQATIGVGVLSGLDDRAEADVDYQALMDNSTDPYATMRSSWLQMRKGEIGEQGSSETLPVIEDIPDDKSGPPAAPDQPKALDPLPDKQDGDAHDKVPGPTHESEAQGEAGGEAKDGPH